MSEAGQFVIIMLVISGLDSTTGGMKTTTAAVLFASACSTFKRDDSIHFFGCCLEDDVIKNAEAIMVIYLVLFLCGGLAIGVMEDLPVLDCLFEAAFAVGTESLSLGLTPTFEEASRIILILLIFLGRVGGLKLIFAAISSRRTHISKLTREKILWDK